MNKENRYREIVTKYKKDLSEVLNDFNGLREELRMTGREHCLEMSFGDKKVTLDSYINALSNIVEYMKEPVHSDMHSDKNPSLEGLDMDIVEKSCTQFPQEIREYLELVKSKVENEASIVEGE